MSTMITMRIIAVKLPMMIPMTRDMVGDMPESERSVLVHSCEASFNAMS